MLKVFVSVWSTDLLAMAASLDPIIDVVDGLHVDITDGHLVPELLFGPHLVTALRARYPELAIETHLMVTEADAWIERMASAGASHVTLHPRSSLDLERSLARIERSGARPGLALEVADPLTLASEHVEAVDRILLMGTEIGIKGADIDPGTYERIREAVRLRDLSRRRPEVHVDGGIRPHTVRHIRAAGADGVTPGSLILSASDPHDAVEELHDLT